jgi:SAM-dependent methyltransferase
VLEIGSGPGRDALALEQIGLSVRAVPTSVRASCASSARQATVADQLDPLRDDLDRPLRDGAPYDGVWANASLLHVAREVLPTVLRRLAAATRPVEPCTSRSRRATASAGPVHGTVGAPRFFTFWREDSLRDILREAGWLVDEVRRGESQPRRPPSESWLAVFATRA